ncbi:MAG TPA: Glu/Leu/Phe/Val dehydrogenase dimerization domain-containing protein [Longimicrobiales bacterium]|nr:Glu/Leu/Phe/Val dehydrogenase dimerization domain-containing protein [Longimicrobiales bacterium]
MTSPNLWERYGRYLRTPPELTVRWQDPATSARGWLVVNSLRGGAAGGGTRMRAGLDEREVVYLAKAMELKFALAGPRIGGAKSGIDFDPCDARKPDVLRRWFRAISPYLRTCVGTGGDLGVDGVADVLPSFRDIGLFHPQEGVVRGHFNGRDGSRAILGRLDTGVKAPVEGGLGLAGGPSSVGDLITGYGVARSIQRAYDLMGLPLDRARARVEGFGNVGAACALYLARAGARIVGLSDARHVLIDPDGMDARGVEELIAAGTPKLLPEFDPRSTPRDAASLDDVPGDVFVAAAASGTLDAARLARLEASGARVLGCGANQPFRERSVGATDVCRAADERFTVLADILANCGMARAYSFLMEPGGSADPGAIFAAVDDTIASCVAEVAERAGGPRGLLAAALETTLDRLAA